MSQLSDSEIYRDQGAILPSLQAEEIQQRREIVENAVLTHKEKSSNSSLSTTNGESL